LDVVDLGRCKAARLTLQPGWRWSKDVKPVAGTPSCQSHHVGTVISGKMHVVHNDGTEVDLKKGDVYVIEPGHDASVTSDKPFVALEFDTITAVTYADGTYAKPS
jgi:mannose-6-phosphate isomerase-like protein (cupin superfamily)